MIYLQYMNIGMAYLSLKILYKSSAYTKLVGK